MHILESAGSQVLQEELLHYLQVWSTGSPYYLKGHILVQEIPILKSPGLQVKQWLLSSGYSIQV